MPEETKQNDTSQLITTVLNVVFTAVIPAVIKLIEELRKSNFTQEDIERLRALVRRPEDYFSEAVTTIEHPV